MGSVHPLRPEQIERNRDYNEGYRIGYRNLSFNPDLTRNDSFMAGFRAGISDLVEDEEALASGDFDHMSDSEREAIYGAETDLP